MGWGQGIIKYIPVKKIEENENIRNIKLQRGKEKRNTYRGIRNTLTILQEQESKLRDNEVSVFNFWGQIISTSSSTVRYGFIQE